MILFWSFSAAMIIVALFFLLRPLRSGFSQKDIDRSKQNISIAKDRLSEIKVELDQGVISQADYDKTREEIEQSLLIDIEQESAEQNVPNNNESLNRATQLSMIFVVPVFAISSYLYLGQPGLIDGAKKQATAPAGHASSTQAGNIGSVEQMVEKLAAKLKENPDNAEGWFMLGRSYMSMKRFKEAVVALDKTNQLIPDNPIIMLRLADAITMSRGGQISGRPFELIKRAVEIKPDEPTGLWLLGMGYEEQGEYQKAISYWNLLMPLLKDEGSISEVKKLIRQAKTKAGINSNETIVSAVKPVEQQAVALKVNVAIDKNLLSQLSSSDTVFVFAKAMSGPPMPLAVVRKQVKDLPFQAVLDDSMAMIPSMKLSSFEKVQVIARVSKSGQAKAQSGDLHSTTRIVTVGQEQLIELTINNVTP